MVFFELSDLSSGPFSPSIPAESLYPQDRKLHTCMNGMIPQNTSDNKVKYHRVLTRRRVAFRTMGSLREELDIEMLKN
jgi:hypothetical protein